MKTLTIASLALLATAVAIPVATAQIDDSAVLRGPAAPVYKVSKDEAVAIARTQGLVKLHEAERDDGRWELEGCDAQSREIEIDVDARTGDIVKIEIDDDRWDADCR
ncbi:PepSY domain-containing protein [Hyphomonas sp. WL0036]|uniref:PepSY domain-containing protein n=1 Tax=Hyphomonas sediminis TaxID=2866160 RepID=UPI001C7EAD15|nr:PepSY domain-containing protein [Hyphomonas sediminis]MBY9066352.1 PepSY domain-containing protein [Hyphomonas sediminis]